METGLLWVWGQCILAGSAGTDAKSRIRNESRGRLLRTLLHYRPSGSLVRKYEFSGKEDAEDNLMRIADGKIANELLEMTFGNEKYQGETMNEAAAKRMKV